MKKSYLLREDMILIFELGRVKQDYDFVLIKWTSESRLMILVVTVKEKIMTYG